MFVVRFWDNGQQKRRRFTSLAKALKFAEGALGAIVLSAD